MIQTGDPTGKICNLLKNILKFIRTFFIFKGTGRGGTSIYGKSFPDEIHPSLKHTG